MTDMSLAWVDEMLTQGVVPDELPIEVAPAEDAHEAARLVRKLRVLDEKQIALDGLVRQEKADIDAFHKRESEVIVNARRYVERALDGWARAQFRDTGVQTHKFPAGTLRLRPRPVTVDAHPDAAEAMNKDGFEQAIRWKPEVDKAAVKHLYESGEVVAVDEVNGTEDVQVVEWRPDPETGEITKRIVPGVVFRRGIQGERGLKLSVQTA